jgi:hypothetical protein
VLASSLRGQGRYVRVTAPDGHAVSSYDDGDMRVQRRSHTVELGAANPESTYLHLVPRTGAG